MRDTQYHNYSSYGCNYLYDISSGQTKLAAVQYYLLHVYDKPNAQ